MLRSWYSPAFPKRNRRPRPFRSAADNLKRREYRLRRVLTPEPRGAGRLRGIRFEKGAALSAGLAIPGSPGDASRLPSSRCPGSHRHVPASEGNFENALGSESLLLQSQCGRGGWSSIPCRGRKCQERTASQPCLSCRYRLGELLRSPTSRGLAALRFRSCRPIPAGKGAPAWPPGTTVLPSSAVGGRDKTVSTGISVKR